MSEWINSISGEVEIPVLEADDLDDNGRVKSVVEERAREARREAARRERYGAIYQAASLVASRQHANDGEAPHPIEPYTVMSFSDIIDKPLAPPVFAWGGVTLDNAEVCELIGPPGLGKSRFMLNVAIAQILGRPYPSEDYKQADKPLKWLFLGTENSLRRWKADAERISATLTPEERWTLGEHLLLPTPDKDGDTDMILDDDSCNRFKLQLTILEHSPDVVVFDPWGDLCPDELKDEVQRRTMRTIRDAARCGLDDEGRQKKNVAVFILNHSRMGNETFAKARSEAGNFGRNSKAIFSQVRNVFNLRPTPETADPSAFGSEIEIIHAKHNNGPAIPPSAVCLDPETMLYNPIPGFDHEAAQEKWDSMSTKRRGGGAADKEKRDAEKYETEQRRLADALAAVIEKIHGYCNSTTFHDEMERASKLSSDKVRKYVEARIADGTLIQQPELERDPKTGGTKKRAKKSGGCKYIGTPEAIGRYLSNFNTLPV
ncbi:MAG: AAA family ATPase [Kiritimatiellae bacterium]|nr:AAA family ATPase [Kiritimatiellia bacterium]